MIYSILKPFILPMQSRKKEANERQKEIIKKHLAHVKPIILRSKLKELERQK